MNIDTKSETMLRQTLRLILPYRASSGEIPKLLPQISLPDSHFRRVTGNNTLSHAIYMENKISVKMSGLLTVSFLVSYSLIKQFLSEYRKNKTTAFNSG